LPSSDLSANRRYLITNADDFGFTRDVNTGIVEAHTRGVLTATTLMAYGSAFEHAVELAKSHESLDIGVHLQLVQHPYPESIPAMLVQLASGRLKPQDEFRQQIEKVLAAGLEPTHLDTHKHIHLLPAVLDAIVPLSREYGISYIRRPFDLPFTGRPVPLALRLTAKAMSLPRRRFSRMVPHATDHFAGFVLTGDFSAADLVHLIQTLPAGVTEFMCHPGHCGAELQAAATRLKDSRTAELAALTDPSVQEAIVRSEVVLTNYRALARSESARRIG
jgi:predicted glycoside hydrolase/deacetylase ChbG (UPF0249 family)